jgi:hypothetical protein
MNVRNSKKNTTQMLKLTSWLPENEDRGRIKLMLCLQLLCELHKEDGRGERILAQSGGHPRSDGDTFYIFS